MEVLDQFTMRGINLTRIESRPTGRALGRYCFSIDCEGHLDDERVGEALMGLRRVCAEVRFLGSYPRLDGAAPELREGTTRRRLHRRRGLAGAAAPRAARRRPRVGRVTAALAAVAARRSPSRRSLVVACWRCGARPSRRRARRAVPPDLDAMAPRSATCGSTSAGRCGTWRWCATTRSATWAATCPGRWPCSTTRATGCCVTAIHGRADTRTYAKNVAAWTSTQQLSPEETEAVTLARRG